MTTTPDTPDSIEEILAHARRIIDRHPQLAPVLAELLDDSDECTQSIDMDQARACFHFHLEQPGLGEALMHLAYHAREQGLGLSPECEKGDDDLSEEPTVPG